MAKAYWIARVDVHDPETYKLYLAANQIAFAKYGARYVVRGGAFECVDGTSRSRNVVIEFPDLATAQACYASPEYQAGLVHRKAASVADVIVIEGYEGPQPGAQSPTSFRH
ncbi:DUF1330 domain-containing protein [Aestuariivirga sp.]|uniref:DUF1330 domain-containing protein n=1 Tax=Aestuariivirga sp. TaxID=2650926 RepID=UPI0039E5E13A